MKMNRFSLSTKVILTLVIVVTLIVLCFGAFFIIQNRQYQLDTFIRTKDNQAEITRESIIPGIEFLQNEFIFQIFRSLEEDKDFVFAIIYDKEGEEFIKSDENQQKIPLETLGTISRLPGIIIIKKTLKSDVQGYLGEMAIAFSTQHIQKEMKKFVIQQLIFLVLLVVSILVTLYFMMRKLILQPMGLLTGMTEAISGGRLDTRVSFDSDDELGQLSQHFNMMAESLQESFTGLQESKRDIQELQEFFTNIIDSSPNGIVTIDKHYRIIKVNSSILEDFPLLKNSLGDSYTNQHQTLKKYTEVLDRIFTIKETITLTKEEIMTDKNEQKVFNMMFYPVTYGNNLFATMILVDISDQTSLEKQLVQSQKMEAVGTLSGGIAHDFNNILSIIMGYVSMLELKEDNPETLRNVSVIKEATQRASDLVKQILIFTRSEAGKLNTLDMEDVINSLLKMGKEIFPRNITLNKVIDGREFLILGDRTQLTQVIMNLLINARDAINESDNRESGEILLKLEKEPSLYTDDKNWITMTIKDNGIGMDETVLSKIYMPFFTTKSLGDGTGLGLSVVYGIVTNHGGEINVDSTPGKGTTFIIRLPLKEGKFEEQAESEQNLFNGSGTVMVVDDEEMILEAAKDMLEYMGFEVIVFNSGYDAADYFKENHTSIEFVILDLMMPNIDGMKTYELLKEVSDDCTTIFSTGHAEKKIISKIKNEFKNTFLLNKPYNVKALSDVVRDAYRH